MKNFPSHLFYLVFGALLFSCNPKPTSDVDTKSTTHLFSDTYQKPFFEQDDRVERIKKIAPELEKLMADYAKSRNIPGIAYGIVVDNQLVISFATGLMNLEQKSPASPSASFRIASMSKSFTAMAIVKLRDEGKLSLSDPVSKYIPEMANLKYLTQDAPSIAIENLLTMTSGFPEDNPWGDRQLDESDQMLMDMMTEGVSFSNVPSYEYEYSNTGYALLGNIISRVSGMPYQEYITQNILLPLGMEQTYWEYDQVPPGQLAIGYRWEDEEWKLEPMLHDGSFGAMGGLITSIEDFSKYVSFHLSAWPPRSDVDDGPIRRSSLREMQTPQFPRLNANARNFSGEPCPAISGYGYGLGTIENCDGLKRVGHGGALPGFGSNYVFFPEYGIGIMAFCNLTYTSPYPLNEIGKLVFETAGLKPRQLPVSDILRERQEQLTQLIQKWDTDLEEKILAENFYLDKSRAHRIQEVQGVLEQAGAILSIGELSPQNQLRGGYKIQTQNGEIGIFFTLTPEKDPKVQQLDILFLSKESE
ncbi:serine hydrolase domain-containing protein [Algoriphagus sp. CAU 1675]|uniref:serine hydrolase domain-containing protein n=1 Tax=Algoriphagus sp. CAU 1675 TaxID=3032597 RepID=UPI0023DB0C15|nr:serine hydrolase domain-containing protein [Algoriphagus sp. CAU 1675]MDF2157301.1 serine hydrolase [Algoriphagus sp. CAU 1675]